MRMQVGAVNVCWRLGVDNISIYPRIYPSKATTNWHCHLMLPTAWIWTNFSRKIEGLKGKMRKSASNFKSLLSLSRSSSMWIIIDPSTSRAHLHVMCSNAVNGCEVIESIRIHSEFKISLIGWRANGKRSEIPEGRRVRTNPKVWASLIWTNSSSNSQSNCNVPYT